MIHQNSSKKEKKLAKNFKYHKKLLQEIQNLFIEMTLSNRKYANPENLLENIRNEEGKIQLGDEEDVGEIGANFMHAIQEAYQIYEPIPNQDSSSDSENDGDTDMEESEEEPDEEEKKGPNTRLGFREAKINAKANEHKPRTLGRELFKDPMDQSRGFIQNLFFGKKIEITEQGSRRDDTIEDSDFFQLFLSLNSEGNLYDAWERSFYYKFMGDDKKEYNKRSYVLSLPGIFTFQLMRVTYDLEHNCLKKIHTKMDFEEEIFADRFLYQNCDKFKSFRKELDNMRDEKARIQSNLCQYDYAAIPKKILDSPDDEGEEEIPDEIESVEIVEIDSKPLYQVEIGIQDIIELTNKGYFPLNKIEGTYSKHTEYPYILHAVIIHEGEAMSGHYYSYVKDHLADTWYKFNDHFVTEEKDGRKVQTKSINKIIKEATGEESKRSAYFLVYINKKHVLPKNTRMKSTMKYYQRFIKGYKDDKVLKENDEFEAEYTKEISKFA